MNSNALTKLKEGSYDTTFLTDCIMQWNQDQLVPGDREINHYIDRTHKVEVNTGLSYTITIKLSLLGTSSDFEVNEDVIEGLLRIYFHLMIEQMPPNAYPELLENFEEIFQFYTEKEVLKLPDVKKVKMYPVEIVERSIRKPFVIEE